MYVCGEEGWTATPRRSNACVHIYSHNEDPASGFQAFWMKNTNSNSFKSAIVQSKIQRALSNRHDLPAKHCTLASALTPNTQDVI